MGISLWQLLILLIVVVLVMGFVFRTSRLGVKTEDEDGDAGRD